MFSVYTQGVRGKLLREVKKEGTWKIKTGELPWTVNQEAGAR
jgi:hypothetical protein